MFMLLPQLDGRHVRLEPLQQRHAAGLPRDSARYSITAPEWPRIKRRLDEMLADREKAAARP